jgi:hypothetical protein
MRPPRFPTAGEPNSQRTGSDEHLASGCAPDNGARTQWLTTHLAFGAERTVAMLDPPLTGDKTEESVHWTEMSQRRRCDRSKLANYPQSTKTLLLLDQTGRNVVTETAGRSARWAAGFPFPVPTT